MLKTGKPLGHIWSAASHFQQQESFRDIRYEECIPPVTSILCRGIDDDFSPTERAAKRRRTEDLAADFLDGKELFISSATVRGPAAWSFKSPVKVHRDAVLSNAKEATWNVPTSLLWQEVDSDSEVLKHAIKRVKRTTSAGTTKPPGNSEEVLPESAIMKMHPRSTAHPLPSKARTTRSSAEPTEQALQRAAALRARAQTRAAARRQAQPSTLRRAATSVEQNVQELPGEAPMIETASSPCRRRQASAPKARVSLRQQMRRPRTPDASSSSDHDSSDSDIPVASVETPCRLRTRTNISTVAPVMTQSRDFRSSPSKRALHASLNDDSSAENQSIRQSGSVRGNVDVAVSGDEDMTAAETGERSEDGIARLEEQFGHTQQSIPHSVSDPKASYHTAPEVTQLGSPAASQHAEPGLQEDSQNALLISHGVTASSRQSFASVNERSKTFLLPDRGAVSDAPGPDEAVNSSAIRQSLQESAQQNAGKRRKSRASRTSGNGATPARRTSRRKSAPSKSAAVAPDTYDSDNINVAPPKPAYVALQKPGDGSTPFQYRRKALRQKADNARDAVAATRENAQDDVPSARDVTAAGETSKKKLPRRVTFPSSDAGPAAAQGPPPGYTIQALPPAIQMSIGQGSSFANGLNMALADPDTAMADPSLLALIDQHTNTVISAEQCDGLRRSSMTKELRATMRRCSARFEKAPDKPASSQPAQNVREQSGTETGARDGQERNESQIMNGPMQPFSTQNLEAELQAAHQDLLYSPEKALIATADPLAETPHQVQDSLANITPFSKFNAEVERPPLKPLTQQPVLSTQALIDNFPGWSTVKKPGVERRTSFEPSPTKAKAEQVYTLASLSISGHCLPPPHPAIGEAGTRESSVHSAGAAVEEGLSWLDHSISQDDRSADPGVVEGPTGGSNNMNDVSDQQQNSGRFKSPASMSERSDGRPSLQPSKLKLSWLLPDTPSAPPSTAPEYNQASNPHRLSWLPPDTPSMLPSAASHYHQPSSTHQKADPPRSAITSTTPEHSPPLMSTGYETGPRSLLRPASSHHSDISASRPVSTWASINFGTPLPSFQAAQGPAEDDVTLDEITDLTKNTLGSQPWSIERELKRAGEGSGAV